MNFSKITDNLFIGDTPSSADYDRLRHMGVRLVLNMSRCAAPRPTCTPCRSG